MDLLVLAKEPRPGRVKTRLSPPCTPAQAARLATAALEDTLRAATRCRADRVVLGLDGAVGPWCPDGVEVVPQGDGDLPRRLARVWSSRVGPALQVGMDTPQVGAAELDEVIEVLQRPDVDAVLGLADDGGWWCLGLAVEVPGVFEGIETSRPDTGARQLERLRELGLRVRLVPTRRDVDTWDDALAAAETAPCSAFARAVRRTQAEIARPVSG